MSATETVRVGNSGVIPIPIGLQHLAGIHAGSEVLIEAAGGTLVIRSKKDRPDAAASERASYCYESPDPTRLLPQLFRPVRERFCWSGTRAASTWRLK